MGQSIDKIQRRLEHQNKRRKAFYVLLTTVILYIYILIGILLNLILQWFNPVIHYFLKKILNLFKSSIKKQNKNQKIAIIGSGLAGCSAAWNLKNKGFDVTLFEKKPEIGGNIRNISINSDLHKNISVNIQGAVNTSVQYFHNLNSLLYAYQYKIETEQQNFETQPICLFDTMKNLWIIPENSDSNGNFYFKEDLHRWGNIISLVKFVNEKTQNQENKNLKSLYSQSLLNPFNYLPLKWLSWSVGISDEFWDTVVQGMYGKFLYQSDFSLVPATILPMISDLLPLNKVHSTVNVTQQISTILEKMTMNIHVNLNFQVDSIKKQQNKYNLIDKLHQQEENGYDNVIFACEAQSVINILEKDYFSLTNRILTYLLTKISYSKDTIYGFIHQDPSIIPQNQQKKFIMNQYRHFIDIKQNNNISQSYIGQNGQNEEEKYFITYQKSYIFNKSQKYAFQMSQKQISFKNIIISWLLQFFQGRNNLFYCGDIVCPGFSNIDSQHLSGLIVSEAFGCKYPYEDYVLASHDYEKFQQFMGFQ